MMRGFKMNNEGFEWEWDALVDAVGEENAVRVLRVFSGLRVYFPNSLLIKKQDHIIKKWHSQGHSVEEIASRMGHSKYFVKTVLEKDKML